MLIAVEEHLRKSRTIEETEFLKPNKQLLPDIIASEPRLARALTRALDLASDIYSAHARARRAPPSRHGVG